MTKSYCKSIKSPKVRHALKREAEKKERIKNSGIDNPKDSIRDLIK